MMNQALERVPLVPVNQWISRTSIRAVAVEAVKYWVRNTSNEPRLLGEQNTDIHYSLPKHWARKCAPCAPSSTAAVVHPWISRVCTKELLMFKKSKIL